MTKPKRIFIVGHMGAGKAFHRCEAEIISHYISKEHIVVVLRLGQTKLIQKWRSIKYDKSSSCGCFIIRCYLNH